MVCHVRTALSMLLSVFSAVGKKLTPHFLESKPFLMLNVGKQQIFEWLWNICGSIYVGFVIFTCSGGNACLLNGPITTPCSGSSPQTLNIFLLFIPTGSFSQNFTFCLKNKLFLCYREPINTRATAVWQY